MDLLLASVLTCAEGKWILDGLQLANMSTTVEREVAIEIILAMPDGCDASDYNYDESTR